MNKTNCFPKIQKAQSTVKLTLATDWDQSINSSIPLSLRAQMTSKRTKTDNGSKILIPESDISYLRSQQKKFQSIESSIYKDPELSQTKYDKSLQSFYSTMYRKSQNKLAFKTKIDKNVLKNKQLNFGQLLKDSNNLNTGLQKYFSDILKYEIKQQSNLFAIPPNRQQAVDLKEWLFFMLTKVKDESKNLSSTDLAEQIQIIYSVCLKEIIKYKQRLFSQIKVECVERGELLQIIWDFYIQLVEQIIISANQEMEVYDESMRLKLCEQEAFYNDQLRLQQLMYQESKDQIKQLEFDYQRALDIDQEQKAQILSLTQEYRESLEMIEQHRQTIDELQVQILLLKSEQTNDGKPENERINIKVQQGQSIVSHLMNFQAKIDSSQKYQLRSPARSPTKSPGKRSSIIFDRWEQLRQQESQLKSQIISLKYLDLDKDQQPSQPKIIQVFGTEDQETQTVQFVEQSNKTEDINNLNLSAKLQQAIQLIKDSTLNQTERQSLCQTLCEGQEACQQNKSIQEQLIQLNKLGSLKQMELMEKEEQCQELQQRLEIMVQDFIQILHKNKSKINRLVTQKSSLIEALKKIETKYEIVINEIEMIEDEEKDSINNLEYFEKDLSEDCRFNSRRETQNNLQQFEDGEVREQMKNKGEGKNQIRMVQSMKFQPNIQKNESEINSDSREVLNQTTSNHQCSQEQFQQQTERNSVVDDISKNLGSEVLQGQLLQDIKKKSSEIHSRKESLGDMDIKSSSKDLAQIKNGSKNTLSQQQSIRKAKQSCLSSELTNVNEEQFHIKKRAQPESSGDASSLFNQQNKKGKKNSHHNISNSPIRERNESSVRMSQTSLKMEQVVEQDEEKNRNQRVKDAIDQYKDFALSKYSQVHRNLHFNLLSVTKQPKKFRRIYSQNTDVANSLLKAVINQQKKIKSLSYLQFNKIIISILSDVSKQAEGYKIPFHVCIYDFIKNKYGFKQVAEKKIKQIYEFIFCEKDENTRVQMLAKYCDLNNEIDEVAQKLLIETFIFFNSKTESSKSDYMITYDAANEFLNEKSQLWLQQSQISQLQQQYKALNLSSGNNKYIINHDQFLMKILDFYIFNKKDHQRILETLFRAADLDGNKLIEYQEFKTLYRAIHSEKIKQESLLQMFLKNADFADEFGDKFLTLPRFTEMSIELSIFSKEAVIKYGEGSDQLKEYWQKEKNTIKLRFLEAKQYSKVKHTFEELENQIKSYKQEKQNILWMSYKLLSEQSIRVQLKYQTQKCLLELLPFEILQIQMQYRQMDQLE